MLSRLALARTSPRAGAQHMRLATAAEGATKMAADGDTNGKVKNMMSRCGPRFAAFRPVLFVSSLVFNGLAGYGLYSLLFRNPELARQEAERIRAHERTIEEMRLQYKFGSAATGMAQPTQSLAPAEVLPAAPAMETPE